MRYLFDEKIHASYRDISFVTEELFNIICDDRNPSALDAKNLIFNDSLSVSKLLLVFKMLWEMYESQVIYQIDTKVYGFAWIVLYNLLQFTWSSSRTVVEESIDVEQVLVDFLMVSHEKLGARGICLSDGHAEYLTYVLKQLQKLDYGKSHEEVSQCLFCLYGHKITVSPFIMYVLG